MNFVNQAIMSQNAFKEHTKEWFLNRVGQLVERGFTNRTPISVKKSTMVKTIIICSQKHALACYNFHRDNKINFIEQK